MKVIELHIQLTRQSNLWIFTINILKNKHIHYVICRKIDVQDLAIHLIVISCLNLKKKNCSIKNESIKF